MKTNVNGADRDMTPAEVAAYDVVQANLKIVDDAEKAAVRVRADARASTVAKLKALGLTADEVSLIVKSQ